MSQIYVSGDKNFKELKQETCVSTEQSLKYL